MVLESNLIPMDFSDLPKWVVTLAALAFIFKSYIHPLIKDYLAVKKQAFEELKTKYETLENECTKMKGEFDRLQGKIEGFRVYLKSHGLEDIPDVNS